MEYHTNTMTVAQLIEKLKEFPQDEQVIATYEGISADILVESITYGGDDRYVEIAVDRI